jgi:hypothetical protein
VRVKEIDHGLTLAAPTAGYVRTPGLHASDLYNAFYKAFDPKRYDKKDSQGNALPFDLAKMELGTSFEEVLEAALITRLFGSRPGEFTAPHADNCPNADEPLEGLDAVCQECGAGTLFSPDYLFDIDGDLVLGEFKCTWYSAKGAPFDPKFSKWITQIKLYLYWLGLTKCRLYVFFVNGDYTPPSPQLRCWELTFTRRELIDEHATILRHARKKGLLVSGAL